jgi:hypothetical protein
MVIYHMVTGESDGNGGDILRQQGVSVK